MIDLRYSLLRIVLVALAVTLILVGLITGSFYFNTFSKEIDKNLENQVRLPGLLMNSQLLRYEAVNKRALLSDLVGDRFIDGYIFDRRGIVFNASDNSFIGEFIGTRIPRKVVADFITSDTTILYRESTSDGLVLHCLTPLRAYDGATPFLYSLISVRAEGGERLKRSIFILFTAGTFISFLLVFFSIYIIIKRSVFIPLERLASAFTRVADGDYSTKIPLDNLSSEIGVLASKFTDMQHAIEDKIVALNHSHEVRKTYLSNISHELRTPLNQILGSSEILLHQIKDPEQHEFVTIVKMAGKNLLYKIDQVLFINHDSKDYHMELFNKGVVDVYSTLWHWVQIYRLQAKRRGVQIEIVTASPYARATVGSEEGLNVIIDNLLQNAVKFSDGGKISCRLSFHEKSSREVSAIIRISDEGIGIPRTMLEEVFEMFGQVELSSNRQQDGLGLGLSIVRQTVDFLGGSISLVSEGLGMGTVATVTLPLSISA